MIIDSNFSSLMERVFAGTPYRREEAEALVTSMIDGRLSDIRIAAVLTGMRFAAPETQLDILSGASESVARHRKEALTQDFGAVDLAGIGHRGLPGSPVLLLAGIVASAAGAKVAFFGSKSFSGQYSNTEFAESLGARLAQNAHEAQLDLKRAGLAFLRASAFYPAQFQHLTAVRRSLGFHTIFDVLVPLANPVSLRGQVLGVFDRALVPVVARLLEGRERALVFYTEEGSNEVSLGGANHVALVEQGKMRCESWTPATFGLEAFAGHGMVPAADVHEAAQELLAGKMRGSALEASVCLNAGIALWCAKSSATIAEGVALAFQTLASGKALTQLLRWQGP